MFSIFSPYMYQRVLSLLLLLSMFCIAGAKAVAQQDTTVQYVENPYNQEAYDEETYEEDYADYTDEEPVPIKKLEISEINSPLPHKDRNVTAQQWKNLTDDPTFTYTEEQPKARESAASDGWAKFMLSILEFFASSAGKVLLWVIVAILVLGIVLWIFKQNGNIFFARKDKKIGGDNIDEYADDFVPANWEQTIMDAAQQGDYRLAVRHGYRYFLFLLQEKELIKYQTAKTNYQYAFELAGSNLHKPFMQLTREYEYAWYGGFAIEKAQFDRYYELVSKLKNELN